MTSFDPSPGPIPLLRGDVLERLEVRRRRADVRHELRVVQHPPRLDHRGPDLLVVLPDEHVPSRIRKRRQFLNLLQRRAASSSGRSREGLQARLAADHVVSHGLAVALRPLLRQLVAHREQRLEQGVVSNTHLLGHLSLFSHGRGVHENHLVVVAVDSSARGVVRGGRRGVDEIVHRVDIAGRLCSLLRRRPFSRVSGRRRQLPSARRRLPRLAPPLIRLSLGQLRLHHHTRPAALDVVQPSLVRVEVRDGSAERSVVTRGSLLDEPVGDDLDEEVLEQRLGDLHLLPDAVPRQPVVPVVKDILRLGPAERAPDASLGPA